MAKFTFTYTDKGKPLLEISAEVSHPDEAVLILCAVAHISPVDLDDFLTDYFAESGEEADGIPQDPPIYEAKTGRKLGDKEASRLVEQLSDFISSGRRPS